MQIVIVAVGKRSEASIESLVLEYQKRLAKDYQIEWKYVPASSSSDSELCRAEESTAIFNQLKPNDQVILLDERGEQKDNQGFAEVFQRLASMQGRLVFIIGGAYGVSELLRQRANFVWSLSKLVFPHRLIRLILVEQLYRTVMITKDHPYHHD
jgi:23S rRNA (pseudouridine1915-N3)-methyltransferase